MPRSISIHVGVDAPGGGCDHPALPDSEDNARLMAGLAGRAGFGSVLLLRGAEATRQAVHDAIAAAGRTLSARGLLFVSFSGHGDIVRNHDDHEITGFDQTWCLHDGNLVDDELVEQWRRFNPGVRILMVSESCHGGGMIRDDDPAAGLAHRRRSPMGRVYRGDGPVPGGYGLGRGGAMRGGREDDRHPTRNGMRARDAGGARTAPCVTVSQDSHGIRASVLLLAACSEHRRSASRVFTKHLLDLWSDGAFRRSYCDLYHALEQSMLAAGSQAPHLQMLGAPDPDFPLETAFHRGGQESDPRRGWR